MTFLLTGFFKRSDENLNVTCLEAQNGKEGLLTLLLKEKVDLVFMDIEMPVMNGLETTKYVREKLPSPKSTPPL